MKINFYTDEFFWYIRKPHDIATSFWNEKSFLEKIIEKSPEILENQFKYFSEKEEYWLLNRLDNETAWLLYFAKNPEIKEEYENLQQQWKTQKIYIADIPWKITAQTIDFPIMHHKNLKEKMITIKKEKDLSKWRWKQHYVQTAIEPLYFDEEKNQTTIKIQIQKWIRHQIRVHLASIWKPIIGDKIYSKYLQDKFLHLRSIGIEVN